LPHVAKLYGNFAIQNLQYSVPAIVFASVTGAVNNKSQKLTTVTSMNKAIFPQ